MQEAEHAPAALLALEGQRYLSLYEHPPVDSEEGFFSFKSALIRPQLEQRLLHAQNTLCYGKQICFSENKKKKSLRAAKYESVIWDMNISPSRYFPTSASFPLLFLRLSDALWKGWKNLRSSISDWKLLSFSLLRDIFDSNKLQEKSIWDFLIFSLSWPITASSFNTLWEQHCSKWIFGGSLRMWSC